MKLLLCYSKDNEELANVVIKYLKDVNESLDICVSCDKRRDRVGKRYADSLHENIDDVDFYIPILTKEFFASRFCVMDFGAAVFNLFNKYKYEAAEMIYPLCVYPLSPDKALEYTIIAHLNAYDIINEDHMEEISSRLGGSENRIKSATKEFIYDIKQLIYGNTNLFEIVTDIKGFAWGGYAEGTVGAVNERFCKVKRCENGVNVAFKLSPGGSKDEQKEKPDFGAFLLFRDTLNMDAFLSLSKNARLSFELDCFTNSFNMFTVEFKTESNNEKVIVGEKTFTVEKECATYEVPLSIIGGENARRAISEINFIILSKNTVEDEGSFDINYLTIKTE